MSRSRPPWNGRAFRNTSTLRRGDRVSSTSVHIAHGRRCAPRHGRSRGATKPTAEDIAAMAHPCVRLQRRAPGSHLAHAGPPRCRAGASPWARLRVAALRDRARAAPRRDAVLRWQAGDRWRTPRATPNAPRASWNGCGPPAAETQRPVSFLLFENDPTATPWRRLRSSPTRPWLRRRCRRSRNLRYASGTRRARTLLAERPTYQTIASLPLGRASLHLGRDIRARILGRAFPGRPAGSARSSAAR